MQFISSTQYLRKLAPLTKRRRQVTSNLPRTAAMIVCLLGSSELRIYKNLEKMSPLKKKEVVQKEFNLSY